jgi:hypothetical protein
MRGTERARVKLRQIAVFKLDGERVPASKSSYD